MLVRESRATMLDGLRGRLSVLDSDLIPRLDPSGGDGTCNWMSLAAVLREWQVS